MSHSLFSHGLSYTTFSYDEVTVTSSPIASATDSLQVSVKITNTGHAVGSEVVQVYVTLPQGLVSQPEKQLRGFAKVKDLAPGLSTTVEITMDKCAVSYWDDVVNCWRADQGEHVVRVGGSSDKLPLQTTFQVARGFEWAGL